MEEPTNQAVKRGGDLLTRQCKVEEPTNQTVKRGGDLLTRQ